MELLPEMLARASAQAERNQVDNIDFLLGDVRDLSALVKEPADVALIANAFHGVPAKSELAGVVRSVLKTGGRFLVVNWYPRPREETQVLGQPRGPPSDLRMSPAETAAIIEPTGFRLVEVVPVGPYHYCAVFHTQV